MTALFPPQVHPQAFYTEIATRYNMPDIWYIDLWPFGPPQMIITGAEASMEVTTTKVYPIHHWVDSWLGTMLGPNVIAAVNGPVWKTLHHMLGPSFSPMAVKSQTATIVEHTMVYHNKLQHLADTGRQFSMDDLTSRAIFDIISAIVFGFSLDAQQNGSPLLRDFKTLFELAQPYLDTWNPLAKFRMWRKMHGAKRRSDAHIRRELNARYHVFRGIDAIPTRRTARSILDRMVVQRIEDAGGRVDEELDPDFVRLVVPK